MDGFMTIMTGWQMIEKQHGKTKPLAKKIIYAQTKREMYASVNYCSFVIYRKLIDFESVIKVGYC